MKKHWEIYLIVLIALAGLFAPMVAGLFTPKADIVVYTQKTCGWCKRAMAYIDENVRPSEPNIKIVEIDIGAQANFKKMTADARKFKVEREVGTPFIVSTDDYIIGWTDDAPAKLHRIITKIKVQKAKK